MYDQSEYSTKKNIIFFSFVDCPWKKKSLNRDSNIRKITGGCRMTRCPNCWEEFDLKKVIEHVLEERNEIEDINKELYCPNCKKPLIGDLKLIYH